MKRATSVVLLILMILMWGLSWPVAKIGLSYTSPTNYIEWRFVFATVMMFLVAWVSKNLVIPRKKDLMIIATVGIFQMGLMMNLSTFGLSLVPAGKATFLTFTTSLWLVPLTAFLDRKIIAFDVLTFCIGLLGVVLLVEPWKGEPIIGYVSLLAAAVSWSVGILCARHLTWHRPLIQLLPWQLLLVTSLTFIIGFLNGTPIIPQHLDPIFIGTLVYTGSIAIALGYWIMILVSKNLSPAITSTGLICVPITSLLLSTFITGEKITFLFLVSVILITGSTLMHIYVEKIKSRNRDEII
ncbi:MAG: DMT family transporter [Rhabdochlamydiaceae bacterium]|nr:DMT family transporter [Rhabdochlamydiaceae bacterium]